MRRTERSGARVGRAAEAKRAGRAASLLALVASLAVGGCSLFSSHGSEQKLPGSSWVAEQIAGGGVVPEARATLEFGEDGRVSGSTGCNRLTGSVTIDGEKLTFAKMATTRRMCPPPLMEQEIHYLTALAAVRRFQIVDGKLLLFGSVADPLVRLAPAEPAG